MEDPNHPNLDYLRLLAKQYPSIQAASTEIINLSSVLNLPKGTEHFISDVHGEYEAFLHVLKNGSGSIKRKIEEIFANSLTQREKNGLATLIYYPEQKISLILKDCQDPEEWYRLTLFRLIKLCRVMASKYTRAQVRVALPEDFAYVIEELLHEQESISNRLDYYNSLIDTIISISRARAFIVAMSELIQRLAIARLHILGDIYDRGPGAHIIMDKLLTYHSVDIQWGNHDILWMGAAAGSEACIANVIRICLRYSNMETLEDGYGISLLPLATFAIRTYADDPCTRFEPKVIRDDEFTENERRVLAQMHKAITIIQLKLEGQIIQRRPDFQMQDRLLLDKIDHERGAVSVYGQEYALNDLNFPTLDPENPYRLSDEEKAVIEKLALSFQHNDRLQQHVRFLYAHGSMYLIYNGNLLYHGCILTKEDGSFKAVQLGEQFYNPRAYMDRLEQLVRRAYFATDDPELKRQGMDTMWYLWSGPNSPLFGKDKMATFERYFVDDLSTHKERMNAYYIFRDQGEFVSRILIEFGLDPQSAHIINGHVPVKVKKGEQPVKANGHMLVIDGGFSKAYQSQTGIAGYTLIYNSYGFLLSAHNPFESSQKAIEEETDLDSETDVLETNYNRIRIKDTDQGREIIHQIEELKVLLSAYRKGLIKEQPHQTFSQHSHSLVT